LIPFIDLKPLVRSIRREARNAFDDVLDRREFLGQESVARLEADLVRHLEVKHAVACASGTDALSLALRAVGAKSRGDLVAIPNLTFWATSEAVVNEGCKPLVIDSAPDDLQMAYDQFIEAHQVTGFRTAIFVHMFGWTSRNLTALRNYCKDKSIVLIEDAAQAFGVRIDHGVAALKDAEIATLSFHPAKVIGGMMDGGAVVTKRDSYARALISLRNHGRVEHYKHDRVGWNSRMSGINAAYLRLILSNAEAIMDDRCAQISAYNAQIDTNDSRLLVKIYGPPEGVIGNGYLNVLTTSDRSEDVQVRMRLAGVDTGRVYPCTIADQPGFEGAFHGDLSVSRRFCEHVINLPVYYGLRPQAISEAVDALHRRVSAPAPIPDPPIDSTTDPEVSTDE
jgi:UDP-2-acetamido-2-deoxy-ribo-hexuluronate aminotransferase